MKNYFNKKETNFIRFFQNFNKNICKDIILYKNDLKDAINKIVMSLKTDFQDFFLLYLKKINFYNNQKSGS